MKSEAFTNSTGINAVGMSLDDDTVVGAGNPMPVFGSLPYNDTATVLAGNATFTGTSRDSGATTGAKCAYGYFNAIAYTDQIGTLSIEGSWDSTTFSKVASVALTASTPATLQIPVMFRYHRVKLVNGATAQGTLQISSSYTAS